jgi:hypothetical protein
MYASADRLTNRILSTHRDVEELENWTAMMRMARC